MSEFLMPLPLLAMALLIVNLLARRGRWRRFLKWFQLILIVLVWLLGTTPVATGLLRAWESPYRTIPVADAGLPAPQWIVVLAAGAGPPDRPSPVAALTSESLFRVAEGVRLQRSNPGSHLLLMDARERSADPSTYLAAAIQIGADPKRISVHFGATDTEAEARAAAGIVPSGSRVHLVTAAYHLARAQRWFRRAGLDPVPAPAVFLVSRQGEAIRFASLMPRSENYRRIELLMHEVLGLFETVLPR